ncbi:alpha/beta hydrolase [Acholeplasma granularum]|uniref:alpha/beta hydrolase n=1 Tax=Acholeplasma granularum TaxID=264635 RepID=UPI000470D92E|nr:alpha/beta hydrolase [Acholeplasma granularum]
MKTFKKIFKISFYILSAIIFIIFITLSLFAWNASKPLSEMYDEIDRLNKESIYITEAYDSHNLVVNNPKAQIIIIPGGLVTSESYLYLAYSLAIEGYNVTVSKALFHLAILTPNYASRFLSNTLPNIIIGHSLGGTVGGFIASSHHKVDHLILLASYTTKPINNASVLLITAENDLVINQDAFNNSLSNYENYERVDIDGGNHAGFGYYGKQSGDGIALITINAQQNQTLQIIKDYLENHL